MTNIKFQQKSNISDCSKDKSLNKEISNWIQHGKRALVGERTPLEQIDINTFSPIKKCPMSETSLTASNFDDTSCASFSTTSESNFLLQSESNTNDFIDQSSSARTSPVKNNSSLLSPTSVKSTNSFKKPSYMKGKFNRNISIEKDGKNKESEKDNFETSFINLNKAVLEHLNSKKDGAQMQNDPDTLFCNLVLAELKQLDDSVKQIKKHEIMQILWRKEKSE